jgi:RNA polymerase sigma-70 factor (ECF subfamily)
MQRVRDADDKSAFDTLYRKHAGPLFGYFWRSTSSREASEELVQETFFKIYRLRAGYTARASFKTYLYTVARSVLINRWVSDARVRAAAQDGADPEAEPSHSDTEADVSSRQIVSRVASAIGSLPERQKSAVLLVRYEGLAYEEAARVLGVSVKAMKSLLNRAREQLVAQVMP